jgi:hypothetical protein
MASFSGLRENETSSQGVFTVSLNKGLKSRTPGNLQPGIVINNGLVAFASFDKRPSFLGVKEGFNSEGRVKGQIYP